MSFVMNAVRWIIDAVVHAYAALAIVPFAVFILVWFGVYLYNRDKKAATKTAMDVTTFFLVGVVSALYNDVFQSTFGFYLLLLVALLCFGLLGNLQYRKRGKIDARRIVRAIWRIGFFSLSVAYLLLMLLSLAKNLF